MENKQYHGSIDRLRQPERLKMMEVERVVSLALQDVQIRSVLDGGTGSGVFAGLFADLGLEVTGIDINPEMVEAAGSHVPNATFITSSIEKTPFDDQAFDLVFMAHVLHEVNEPLVLARESVRITGKRVVFLEWPKREEESGPPFHHRIDEAEVAEIAAKCGVKNARIVHLKHQVLYVWDLDQQ